MSFPLTSNSVDESNSHGSRIYLAKDTELINLDVMGRKGNEIKHNKTECNKKNCHTIMETILQRIRTINNLLASLMNKIDNLF